MKIMHLVSLLVLAMWMLGCEATPPPMPSHTYYPDLIPNTDENERIDVYSTINKTSPYTHLLEIYPAIDGLIIDYLNKAGYQANFRPGGESSYIPDNLAIELNPIDVNQFNELSMKNMQRPTEEKADLLIIPIIVITQVELSSPYSSHTWHGVKRNVLLENVRSSGWVTNRTITLYISILNRDNELVFQSKGGIALGMKSSQKKAKGSTMHMLTNPISFQDIPYEHLTEAVEIALHPFIEKSAPIDN